MTSPLPAAVDPAPLRARRKTWACLGEDVFDVVVIGGGINGAGVARDAVLRGLSVALIERTDFAAEPHPDVAEIRVEGELFVLGGCVDLVEQPPHLL